MTHEQRLALIYKAVPRVRYIHAMPYAGTITGDHFYGDGESYSAYDTRARRRNAPGEFNGSEDRVARLIEDLGSSEDE